MKIIDLVSINDIDDGEALRIELPDMPAIAVYNINGEFFATDDLCSHGEASLADGYIENDQIICPFHEGGFDIRTGKASKSPCSKDIKCHKIQVNSERIQLVVEE